MHWSEFVFPPTCPGCGTEVWHRGEWCEACFNELYDVRHVTDLDGLALREVYVIGHYDKGLKSILGDIKFHGKRSGSNGPLLFCIRLWLTRFTSFRLSLTMWCLFLSVPKSVS